MHPDTRSGSIAATRGDIDDILDKPGHLIRLVHQKSVALFEAAFGKLGVTVGQQMVLVALFKHGSLDLTSIAHIVTWDRSTTGGVVSRLSRDGLVRTTSSPRDQRVKLISLTPAGRALILKMAPAIRKAQGQLLASLEPQERAELKHLLRKIVGRSSELHNRRLPKFETPFAGQAVSLLDTGSGLADILLRRFSDLGADVSARSSDQIRAWGLAQSRLATGARSSVRKLIVLVRAWPNAASSADAELHGFLRQDIPLLARLAGQGNSNLHIVAGLLLAPDKAPGQFEAASAMKHALLAITNRHSALAALERPTLATVISSAKLEAGSKQAPLVFWPEIDEATDAIMAAAEMRLKRHRAVIVDQAPELG